MHQKDDFVLLTELVMALREQRKTPPDLTLLSLVSDMGELTSALATEGHAGVHASAFKLAVAALRLALDGDILMDDWRKRFGLDATVPAAREAALAKPVPVPPLPAALGVPPEFDPFKPPARAAWNDTHRQFISVEGPAEPLPQILRSNGNDPKTPI